MLTFANSLLSREGTKSAEYNSEYSLSTLSYGNENLHENEIEINVYDVKRGSMRKKNIINVSQLLPPTDVRFPHIET
jgi:hypothetical protein